MRTHSLAEHPRRDRSSYNPSLPTGSKVRSARSQNRAAAHAYDLAQWREYRLAMARSDDERDAVETEYAERLEAGPTSATTASAAISASRTSTSSTRAASSEILTAFDQVRSWLYRNQRKPHGQAVSRVYREVLSVLLSVRRQVRPGLPVDRHDCQAGVLQRADGRQCPAVAAHVGLPVLAAAHQARGNAARHDGPADEQRLPPRPVGAGRDRRSGVR